MKIIYVEKSFIGNYYFGDKPIKENRDRREFRSIELLLDYLNTSQEGMQIRKKGNLGFKIEGLSDVELEKFNKYLAKNNPRQKII